MDPASTDPIWKDACEPDGDRNAEGVLIASLRLLTELVDEPPKDGPSYGSFPTGNAIMPDRCDADPALDFLDFTDSLFFFTPSAKSGYRCDTFPLFVAVLLFISDFTDSAFTGSFLTGIATALLTEKDLEDPPGSDLGRCA
jgi:hypothetical protein